MSRLALVTLVLVLGLSAGCKRGTQTGGSSGARAESARRNAEALAVEGATGAAEAQAAAFIAAGIRNPDPGVAKVPPAPEAPRPKALPRPGPAPVIRERVAGTDPAPTEAEAERYAVIAAQDVIERRLAELDPPVKYRPSANEVEKEFLRKDSRGVRPPSGAEKELITKLQITGNPVYVEYDVEVTPDQVRQLRTRDRVADALRVFGMVAVLALAGFLFLRADEWTKGYLTRWLAAGAVLLAGGAAAALYFV